MHGPQSIPFVFAGEILQIKYPSLELVDRCLAVFNVLRRRDLVVFPMVATSKVLADPISAVENLACRDATLVVCPPPCDPLGLPVIFNVAFARHQGW